MKNEDFQSILTRAMTLCSHSEKCRQDILRKITDWGIEAEEDREAILDRLVKDKFIDEERYANNYVSDKHRFNSWGKIKIRLMLKSKEISEDIIEKALDTISQQDYLDTLRKELVAKKKRTRAVNQYDLKGKLFRFAESKGYEYELIYTVINEIS